MKLDRLLSLAWTIAEVEARALGSAVIEPEHFLLAALKIVDVDFPEQLDKLDISSEVWKSMCQDANKVQQYLDVLPDKITTVRRRIRHRLARNANPPIPDDQVIHRSRKTRAAFYDAANQVELEFTHFLRAALMEDRGGGKKSGNRARHRRRHKADLHGEATEPRSGRKAELPRLHGGGVPHRRPEAASALDFKRIALFT